MYSIWYIMINQRQEDWVSLTWSVVLWNLDALEDDHDSCIVLKMMFLCGKNWFAIVSP